MGAPFPPVALHPHLSPHFLPPGPPPPATLSSPLTWGTLNFSRGLSMVGAGPRSSQGESLRPEGGRLWKLCTTQVTLDRGRGMC